MLQSPQEVYTFRFNTTRPNVIVAGSLTGQVSTCCLVLSWQSLITESAHTPLPTADALIIMHGFDCVIGGSIRLTPLFPLPL
jgi:hypothetical protein